MLPKVEIKLDVNQLIDQLINAWRTWRYRQNQTKQYKKCSHAWALYGDGFSVV